MSTAIEGMYYDGERPIGVRATLMLSARDITLVGEQIMQRYTAQQLRVSPRIGKAARFIALPDGTQFQCNDHPALDCLPHDSLSEGPVAWLEQRIWVAIIALAATIAFAGVGYFYGLPRIANYAAVHMPQKTEHDLGQSWLRLADEQGMFRPTQIDEETQAEIRTAFAALTRGLPFEKYYEVNFRSSSVGANAFAFPGGTIIITDDMVDLAESTDEILAVLAHEAGHVERHHTTRQIIQNSAVAVAVATVTADAATLSAVVAGAPTLLVQMKNSREFESEADDFGFALLKRHGISPETFATLMTRLSEEHGGDKEDSYAFLSSHPITKERVARAEAAARDFVPPTTARPSDTTPGHGENQ